MFTKSSDIYILKYLLSLKKVYTVTILTYGLPINVLSKSESVKFSLIESVICLFTDSSVKKIFFTIKSVTFH